MAQLWQDCVLWSLIFLEYAGQALNGKRGLYELNVRSWCMLPWELQNKAALWPGKHQCLEFTFIRTSFVAWEKDIFRQKQDSKFTEMLVCVFSLHLKVEWWQLQWSDGGSSSGGWWWVGVPTRNQARLSASLCFRQEVKMSGYGRELKTQIHSWSNDLGGIGKLKVAEVRHGKCDGGGQQEHVNLSVQLS